MRSHRMIGMIQPDRKGSEQSIFKTGCAGKISGFEDTEDGRYLITLTGVCRFDVREELAVTTRYRQVVASWNRYAQDLQPPAIDGLDRGRLLGLLRAYFHIHDLTCNWSHIENAPDERLITCLSMICPLDAFEKQLLLEAEDGNDRAAKFMTLIEIAIKSANENCCSGKCH